MRPSLAAALALWLCACATLDESECRSVDWHQLGHRDGEQGHSRTRLESHREACSEFGLAADDEAWRQGYSAGLESYCVVENGYRVGRNGGNYAQVCPAESESDFHAAWELGRETHDVERQIGELDRRIDSVESRLINDKALPDDSRRDLRRQLAELYREMSWLRRARDRLDAEWRRGF